MPNEITLQDLTNNVYPTSVDIIEVESGYFTLGVVHQKWEGHVVNTGNHQELLDDVYEHESSWSVQIGEGETAVDLSEYSYLGCFDVEESADVECQLQICHYKVPFIYLWTLQDEGRGGIHNIEGENTVSFDVNTFLVVNGEFKIPAGTHHKNLTVDKGDALLSPNDVVQALLIECKVGYEDQLTTVCDVSSPEPLNSGTFEDAESCTCDIHGEVNGVPVYRFKVDYGSDPEANECNKDEETDSEECHYGPWDGDCTLRFGQPEVELSEQYSFTIPEFKTVRDSESERIDIDVSITTDKDIYSYPDDQIKVMTQFTQLIDSYNFEATLIEFQICRAGFGECVDSPEKTVYRQNGTDNFDLYEENPSEGNGFLQFLYVIYNTPPYLQARLEQLWRCSITHSRRRRRYLLAENQASVEELQASNTYRVQDLTQEQPASNIAFAQSWLASAFIIASVVATIV